MTDDRLGVDAIAARFRRWAAPTTPRVPPDTPAAAPAPSPDGPRGWLTAEAVMPPGPPPVTGQDPSLYSNSPGPAPRAAVQERPAPGSHAPSASSHRPVPGGAPSPGRPPKRRRWAVPTSPAKRRAEPIDPPPAELHLCPFCHKRHQPIALGGGGMADVAGQVLLADHYASDGRPDPLGRGDADTSSLRRDAFNPWRGTAAELPPTAAGTTFRDRIAHLWYGGEA